MPTKKLVYQPPPVGRRIANPLGEYEEGARTLSCFGHFVLVGSIVESALGALRDEGGLRPVDFKAEIPNRLVKPPVDGQAYPSVFAA